MKHIRLIAVPDSIQLVPNHIRNGSGLLADATAPIFAPEERPFWCDELVAVVYRNAEGKPVHGGLFGYIQGRISWQDSKMVPIPDSVVSLALVDPENDIDTSTDPAWVAFGLLLMRGPVRIQFAEGLSEVTLPRSILDIGAGKPIPDEMSLSVARAAVLAAYLNEVLPQAQLAVA